MSNMRFCPNAEEQQLVNEVQIQLAQSQDQRGLPRPSGQVTDIGAYELQHIGSQIPALTADE